MWWIGLLIILGGCAVSRGAEREDPTLCDRYAAMTENEAEAEFSRLQQRIRTTHAGLELESAEEDPRWVELGETLGANYSLCVCNSELAEDAACLEFRSMMEERNSDF